MLLGLGRGSGPRSVGRHGRATGAARSGGPLLGVRRATTRAACAALELPVWDDPWNADPAYTRVRLRTEVLPLLEDVLGGGVAPALARTAGAAARGPRRRSTRWPRAELRRLAADGGLPAGAAGRRCPPRCAAGCCAAGCAAAGVPDLQAVHLAAVDALLTRLARAGPGRPTRRRGRRPGVWQAGRCSPATRPGGTPPPNPEEP